MLTFSVVGKNVVLHNNILTNWNIIIQVFNPDKCNCVLNLWKEHQNILTKENYLRKQMHCICYFWRKGIILNDVIGNQCIIWRKGTSNALFVLRSLPTIYIQVSVCWSEFRFIIITEWSTFENKIVNTDAKLFSLYYAYFIEKSYFIL